MTCMMGVPNNQHVSSFSVLAKWLHVIMIAGHEYTFEDFKGLAKIALFGSRGSELRLPAEVACMHALNGNWQTYIK